MQVLRPGVLNFFYDPEYEDDTFQLFIEEPVHKLARDVLLDSAKLGSLIVLLVFLPVKLAIMMAPSVFPLDISYETLSLQSCFLIVDFVYFESIIPNLCMYTVYPTHSLRFLSAFSCLQYAHSLSSSILDSGPRLSPLYAAGSPASVGRLV